jgi:carboxyl-terminal processing protease
MVRCRFLTAFLLSAAIAAAAPSIENQLTLDQRRDFNQEALILIEYLQDYHYSDRPFFELDTKELLERFASDLDYARMTFTAADLDFMRHRFERNLKTVYLFKGDLHPAFEIYDLFAKRARARATWIQQRLFRPFEDAADKSFPISRHDAEWPADETAADDLWERRLASEVIAERLRGLNAAEAIAEVRRQYLEWIKQLDKLDAAAVRERFLDTMLQTFDPHSGYFRREVAKEFEKALSTVAEGIGLDVDVRGERAFVASIDMGGPADRAGEIRVGDEILSVAGIGGDAVPVKGRKRHEIVALLAGKPHTAVQLVVKSPGAAEARTVSVTREQFAAVEYQARGALVQVPDGSGRISIGLISIPNFYGDTGSAAGGRTVSGDVRELLEKLTAGGARGIVIDLRENGGGLLDEAVKLTGLFLREGPVAYVRGLDAKVEGMRDEDPTVTFAGSLVILTSRATASASEMFSGALQHYHRALVVGTDTTYGKGTAQSYIDLHALRSKTAATGANNWGLLRVTRQYYYLPNGRSPQRTGILSDVVLPDDRDDARSRETDLPHALPTESISRPATPSAATSGLATWSDELRGRLQAATAARLVELPEFKIETQVAKLTHDWAERKVASLDFGRREHEWNELEASFNQLRSDRRRLRSAEPYPRTLVDTEPVAKAKEVHQATLRRRCDWERRGHTSYFDGTTFYFPQPPTGRIRELNADSLDYRRYFGDAASLAKAWSDASGTALAADAMTSILHELDRRDDDRESREPFADVFRHHVSASLEQAKLDAGLEAFFAEIVKLDPPPTPELPILDAQEREGLRLVADWLRWAPPPADQPTPGAKP